MSDGDASALQRDAAAVDASVWVAASAGTGKTKVLTDRVLALMLAGSAPASILCLTFTKAAAAEMANRLHDRLSRWTTLPDGALAQDLVALTGAMPDEALCRQARRLFARVLDTPGGMRIDTMHAFCQALLRRFPIEAGVAPHFDVMDERSAREALFAAREAVLAAARLGDEVDLAAALAEVTRHVTERRFDEMMALLALERARLRAALADGHTHFLAILRRILDLAPDATEAAVIAAACARDAGDEPALRAAARRLTLSSSARDRERAETLARWLADPSLRVAAFDDYVAIFLRSRASDGSTSSRADSLPRSRTPRRRSTRRQGGSRR
jgi:ATP-dependent helicase/nuclease subunit A